MSSVIDTAAALDCQLGGDVPLLVKTCPIEPFAINAVVLALD